MQSATPEESSLLPSAVELLRHREASRRYREQRKREGKCRDCGSEALQSLCPRCAEKHNAGYREYYRWARSLGLCVKCRSESKQAWCEACKVKYGRKAQ